MSKIFIFRLSSMVKMIIERDAVIQKHFKKNPLNTKGFCQYKNMAQKLLGGACPPIHE
jgi:hypothetical protein